MRRRRARRRADRAGRAAGGDARSSGGFSGLLASRNGARFASYFTLAWFDQFLRGDPAGGARFFAETFDDSVDVSSIGTGGIGPGFQNQPPMIGGLPLTDAYSYYYPGALAALGADCVDMLVVACRR